MWRLFSKRAREAVKREEELREERGKLAALLMDADRHRVTLDRRVEDLMKRMLQERATDA